jgi:hypothetical protein
MSAMGRGEVEVFIAVAGHVTSGIMIFKKNFTATEWNAYERQLSSIPSGCTPHYASPEPSNRN